MAERVNMAIFNEIPAGSTVRIAGRCEFQAESQKWILKTFEGGNLLMSPVDGDLSNQLVEVIGTKGQQGEVSVTQICKLPEGEMDGELWNQAVQMAHHSKLRHLFQPKASA
eukprot:CAMPEP_0114671682 /NCGR_PEP_ID=MMETSP0191-20121206/41547_1 /TAXON_ID=126664 /ORGANISM="Sorites sp." /LENGTH=110 /DNA_ID=CAMNT_0001932059 /DNA_START=54 /DNA_END=386 /DNA_ORIENTATION=-